jgi:deazaflavin-dependent oxidoreductase (nitroreductase family)
MKIVKVLLVAALVYVGIVVVFESLLGVLQPTNEATIVITTTDAQGKPADRVVTRVESDGKLYVSANHWPRAWYRAVLANPDVQVTVDGQRGDYVAVPVTGAEHERLMAEHPHSLLFRFVTGFPPRYFVRLDPRPAPAGS